jgi:CBS domain-containing protein
MTTATKPRRRALVLGPETAADLMVANPLSVRQHATVREATAFLIDKGYSAAPVIDEAGRPVGVLSRADIIVHDRERAEHAVPEYFHRADLATAEGELLPKGFQVEAVDRTTVEDIMTPAVFAVSPDAPAAKVIEDMCGLKVHRLFVVGKDGVLLGVISALDVLKHLRPEN